MNKDRFVCKALVSVVVAVTLCATSVPNAYGDPATVAFLDDFWNSAWGLDFVEGQSGMLLEDAACGTYGVLVVDTGAEGYIVAQGSYLEAVRLALSSLAPTSAELAEAGLISFDHFVVAGTINGSSGFQGPVFGLAAIVVTPGLNAEDPPVVAHGFTPLALADTLDAAVSMACAWWERSEIAQAPMQPVAAKPTPAAQPTPAGQSGPATQPALATQPVPATQPAPALRDCEAEYRLCRAAAWERSEERKNDILADSLVKVGLCATGCTLTTVAWPLCYSACSAAVLARQIILFDASNHQLKADYLDCERNKLECEAENAQQAQ